MPRVLGSFEGDGRFFVGEVPLYLAYPLDGQGVKFDHQKVRQVPGPYGKAYEPTGHLRDTTPTPQKSPHGYLTYKKTLHPRTLP